MESNKNNKLNFEKRENHLKFKSGQLWEYKTRNNEKKSYLKIINVDDIGVYIKLYNLKLKLKNNKIVNEFSMPIMKDSFKKSINKYIGSKNKVCLDCYYEWQELSGSYFITEIKSILEMVENNK